MAPAYADVLSAAGTGPKTLAERVAKSPAFTSFLLKRETVEDVQVDLPATEEEAEVCVCVWGGGIMNVFEFMTFGDSIFIFGTVFEGC